MTDPIRLEIPHQLGKAAAHERVANGMGKFADFIPGGHVTEHHWEGDELTFTVEAMGQRVTSKLEVLEEKVNAQIDLPPMLALFANKIREKLTRDAPKLLK